jgi:peptidoglycan biosynthesis protein MviN/MurJ (putative lipid II flippase)
MWLLLRRRVGGLEEHVAGTLARAAGASIVMGAAVWFSWRWLAGILPAGALAGRVLHVAVPAALGAGVYLASALLLGMQDLAALWQAVRRRLTARGEAR